MALRGKTESSFGTTGVLNMWVRTPLGTDIRYPEYYIFTLRCIRVEGIPQSKARHGEKPAKETGSSNCEQNVEHLHQTHTDHTCIAGL